MIRKLKPESNGHTLTYLRALWPDSAAGYLLLWLKDGRRSLWFRATDLQAVATAAVEYAGSTDVYLGCALSPHDHGPSQRCKAQEAAGIPGLWADIDIAGPAHRAHDLPPDLDSAASLARAMPFPPSLIVHSGHGIYPWWLLRRPWLFGGVDDRAAAAALVRDWQQHLQQVAAKRGWTIDSTHDLARVLRLPGATNHKGGHPVPVTADLPPTVRRFNVKELTLCNTEDTEDTEDTAHPSQHRLSSLRPSCARLRPSVLHAITSTLPKAPGQRRRGIFVLCRYLKAIPDLASADLPTLRPVVVEWHRQALPFITTKAFTETWADFIDAWARVKFPAGQGVVDAAFQRAVASKPPPKAVALYAEPPVLLLASLCRELQRIAGDGPFFLDCRTAGRLVGFHHATAWRLLTVVLPADGILAGGAKGSKGTHKANEYRYIAD